jgi:hypothetical protein
MGHEFVRVLESSLVSAISPTLNTHILIKDHMRYI